MDQSKVRFHQPYDEITEFQDQNHYTQKQNSDLDENPAHFVHATRPRAVSRSASNTYAPSRTPTRTNSQTGHINNTDSKGLDVGLVNVVRIGSNEGTYRRRPDYQRNRSSSGTKAQYKAQERAYVQKLQQEPENAYYESGLAQFQLSEPSLDDEEDEEDGYFNNVIQEGGLGGALYDEESLYSSLLSTDAAARGLEGTIEELNEIPVHNERLEWITMLATVMTGDVVKSEKKRIQGTTGVTESTQIMAEIWLGLRAKSLGRAKDVERRIVDDARAAMDPVLEEVCRFQIKANDSTPASQVSQILSQIDKCESMFPSIREMLVAKPIVGSAAYIKNVEALNSWTTITTEVHAALGILKKWTGNEDLDVTVAHKGTTGEDDNLLANIADESSFIERVMKENGLKGTFERQSLKDIDKLVSRAKTTMAVSKSAFDSMHLPPYLDELLLLINFPTKLIEEALKLRLVYAKKLDDPTMVMVDQMLDDFVMLLNQAVEIKEQYMLITKPEPNWTLPECIDENFDHVVLDALQFYFRLLQWKLMAPDKSSYAKEAEILEAEYEFLDKIARLVEEGDVHVAEQFSILTNKLLNRVLLSFQKQLSGPKNKSNSEMHKHYTGLLENTRLRHRKLTRFSKTLSSRFENATEYSINTPESWYALLDTLEASGHVFAYTASTERDGIYIIGDPQLAGSPDTIKSILRTFQRDSIERLNQQDDMDAIASYVLILGQPSNYEFRWNGRKCDVNIPEPNIDIKSGRLRLVADGSRKRLQNANLNFIRFFTQDVLTVVVPRRANLTRVNKELAKIDKVDSRLSMAIIDSVRVIRDATIGAGFECQDLVQTTFSFATDFGQRSLRYMPPSRRVQQNLKLITLAIDWVSFVCDDCNAADRKTFRWTVTALEFAMMMTRGKNILVLDAEEYTRLRKKVARCMTLLISHFDIMGARSAAQLEREKLEHNRNKKNNIYDVNGRPADEESLALIKSELMRQLDDLEIRRKAHQEEHQMAGKVLDDTISENRSLMYLASSLSNITMRWQQGRFIGGGSFGNVYQGVNLDTGEVMAVKEIRLQDPQSISGIVKSIKDEMTVLEMLNHPNIVSYYGVEVHRDKVYIFMELCQGGSLASQLEHGRIAEETVIQVYTLQMLEGLAHLHERGIVHRDIKPENVLLDHNGVIKFVDFGAAKVIAKRGRTKAAAQTQVNSMTGTPMYMSPEIITGSDKGRQGAMDIWSLGCCVLEMATAQRPWSNLDNEWAIMYHIAGGHAPNLPNYEQLSQSGQDFLERCFDRDPHTRASAVELLNDPWMIDIRTNTGMASPQTPTSEYNPSSGSASTPGTESVRSARLGD